MQITSKGQVTIPLEVRNRLGLLPYTRLNSRSPEVTPGFANPGARTVQGSEEAECSKPFVEGPTIA
jgi:hypothetical protein